MNLQTAVQDLSLKAQAYGFPGVTVDGNDVLLRSIVSVRKRASEPGREMALP